MRWLTDLRYRLVALVSRRRVEAEQELARRMDRLRETRRGRRDDGKTDKT